MVSLIILLLGLFTAGVVVGVFIMALLEFRQIDAVSGKKTGAGTGNASQPPDNATTVATTVKQT